MQNICYVGQIPFSIKAWAAWVQLCAVSGCIHFGDLGEGGFKSVNIIPVPCVQAWLYCECLAFR